MEVKAGYKLTEVGVIPKEWEVRRLLSAVRIANGQVDPRREPFRSMMLVAPDHIESGTGTLRAMRTAAEQRAISGKYLFEAGDIVYSKIRPYLRKAILANFPGLCSADMYPLRPASDIVGGFILPSLLAHRFTKYAESVSVRSGMPKINRAELADFELAIPPLPEQRAIAAALSDVDALLGGLDRLIAKKRDLKRAAMQQLLTGQTRLPGFSGEWEVQRLSSLVTTGPTNGYSGRSAKGARGTPTLSLSATTSGILVLNDETVKRLEETIDPKSDIFLQSGDVLVQRSNTLDLVGTTVVFDGQSGVYVYPDLMMRMRFREEATAHWFWRYANSVAGRRFFMSVAAGSSGSMPKISGATLRKMQVPVPALQEQSAISAMLSDMDAELSALEARRAKTRTLKQAMMQELLTGRTRLVPDGGADG